MTGEGTRLIEYRSTDSAGNVEAIKSLSVKIDTVNPTVAAEAAGDTTKTVTLTATDATSGVASIEYQVDDATTWTTYTTPLTIDQPGTHVVRYRATDVAGNQGTGQIDVIVPQPADTTAPTTTLTIPNADGKDDWYTTRPTFTLAATDAGSGVASTEYRIAGEEQWTTYQIGVPVTGEGSTAVEYRSTDAAGNVEATKSQTIKVDTVDPTVSAKVAGDRTKTVTLAATDATSGVESIEYQLGDETAWTRYTSPLTFDEPGTYVVRYRATDVAGNRDSGEIELVVSEPGGPVEVAKPTVTMTTVPGAANGRSNWFTSPVTVVLAAAGGEGKLTMEYRIGNGPWTAYTAPFQVTSDGVTLVQARATDAAGKSSSVETVTIKMDATAPTVAVSGIADKAKLDVAAVRTALVTTTDATSGVAERVIRLNGEVVSSPASIDALSLRTGTHRLEVAVLDEAGNLTSESIIFTVVATYGGAKKLVNRLDDEGLVGAKLGTKLKQELKAAKSADKSDDERQARKALKRFKKLASLVGDDEARRALKHLSLALKAQL